jgi:hypothetical protein
LKSKFLGVDMSKLILDYTPLKAFFSNIGIKLLLAVFLFGFGCGLGTSLPR